MRKKVAATNHYVGLWPLLKEEDKEWVWVQLELAGVKRPLLSELPLWVVEQEQLRQRVAETQQRQQEQLRQQWLRDRELQRRTPLSYPRSSQVIRETTKGIASVYRTANSKPPNRDPGGDPFYDTL